MSRTKFCSDAAEGNDLLEAEQPSSLNPIFTQDGDEEDEEHGIGPEARDVEGPEAQDPEAKSDEEEEEEGEEENLPNRESRSMTVKASSKSKKKYCHENRPEKDERAKEERETRSAGKKAGDGREESGNGKVGDGREHAAAIKDSDEGKKGKQQTFKELPNGRDEQRRTERARRDNKHVAGDGEANDEDEQQEVWDWRRGKRLNATERLLVENGNVDAGNEMEDEEGEPLENRRSQRQRVKPKPEKEYSASDFK